MTMGGPGAKEVITKITSYIQEADNLGLYQEMGDRTGWEACRQRCDSLLAEIEALGGGKPPWGGGCGAAFESVEP